MKHLIKFLILLFIFLSVFSTPSVFAFSSVLTGKISVEVFTVDGTKIIDFNRVITLRSRYPIFSGYTLPNIKLTFVIRGPINIKHQVLTDANGFWKYTVDTPLKAGQYSVLMEPSDSDSQNGSSTLVAKMNVPQTTGATNQLSALWSTMTGDHINISSLNLGSLGLLSVAYILL